MAQELKVAVIDDDRMSSHNWNILFKFIGETPLMMTGANWQQVLEKESESSNIIAVVVGNLMDSTFNENAAADLIKAVHEWNNEVPILLSGHQNVLESLSETSQRLVLEVDKDSTNYQMLSQALKSARQLKGFTRPELKSSLISETGTAMFRSLVGDSEQMQQVRSLIDQVADKNVNVLIIGESGTGKEIVARNLHYKSGRGDDPFVAVNCAAISAELLFGYEAGYNGSKVGRVGYFEKAAGGTLFLDKVSEMPLEIQARVMAALENQYFERLGSTVIRDVRARIVAGTHKNLEERIQKGLFQEDLFYRLSVLPIQMPALKNRVEDIPDLVIELIARLEHQDDNSIRFNSSALLSLQRHGWAGNVRELANLVERLSIVRTNDVIAVNDLPVEYRYMSAEEIARLESPDDEEMQDSIDEIETDEDMSPSPSSEALQPLNGENLAQYLENFEKHYIQVALEDSDGSLAFAADRLRWSQKDLKEKMKHHGL